MKSTFAGLLAVTALTASMSALASSETLTYTSAPFTNAWDDNGNATGAVAVGSYYTATLTLSSPLGDNFNGSASNDITSLVFQTFTGNKTYTLNLAGTQAEGSVFDFTTNASGAITGWYFTAGLTSNGSNQLPASSSVLFHSCSVYGGCASGSYNGQAFGNTGDWYDYTPGSSTGADGCTYSSSSCGGSTSGAVGKWTVAAPEMEPKSAAAGIALLIGGLMVLRGRRRGTALTSA